MPIEWPEPGAVAVAEAVGLTEGYLTVSPVAGGNGQQPFLSVDSSDRTPVRARGLLQYLAPIFQFLCGVIYFHEAMPAERWAGFALVWAALAVLVWDAVRRVRADRARPPLGVGAAATAAAPGTATATAPSVTR